MRASETSIHTRRGRTLTAAFLAALVLALAIPGVAEAAPNRVSQYEARTILTSDGRRAMLIGEELSPDVSLPAEIRVNVPKGLTISWAGEILGGDPSQDPKVEYRVEPGADEDTVVMTLSRVRRGQVEAVLPALPTGAGAKTADISWRVPEPADSAELAVEVPTGAQVSSVTPGSSATTANNAILYSKRFAPVKAGQPLTLAVTYTGGTQAAPPAQQQAPPAQSGSVPPSGATAPGVASPATAVFALAFILGVTLYALRRVRPVEGPVRTHSAPAHEAPAARKPNASRRAPEQAARPRTTQRRKHA